MKHYIALTIGPIYSTIKNAKKVRELFGSSYFFSWFMFQVIDHLSQNENIDIVVPYFNAKEIKSKIKTVGYLHDRFIAVTRMDARQCRQMLNTAIEHALEHAVKTIDEQELTKNELRRFLTIHTLVADETELKRVDDNLVFAINKILDAKELHYPFGSNPLPNYTYQCTEEERKLFEKDEFSGLNPAQLFGFKLPYVKKNVGIDIESFQSTYDLSGDIGYYAVVTADGDKMGKKISNLMGESKDITQINELSKNLFRFFLEEENVREITNETFGGELIYAGGDDILALLPVKYGDNTVMDYLTDLSDRFKKFVGEDVSLSFGVNIVYYKYPMKNAISEAFELLYEAKNWKEDLSNIAKIQLVKHSGQKYDTIHCLGEKAYGSLNHLIKGSLNFKANDSDCASNESENSPCFELPHAVHHTLDLYRQAIIQIFQENKSVTPMFERIFDDSRTEAQKRGIHELERHIENLEPTTKDDFNRLYGDLNIVKFLRGDRDDLTD